MTDTRDITLGGRTFAIPALPLRVNRVVYPACRKLVQSDLIGRVVAAQGALECSEEEFDALADMAFRCASLAEPELTREAFDAMPVTPPELLDAFFAIRYQTGAWTPAQAAAAETPAEDGDAGEAAGA